MDYLITGATGFIGRHLVPKLLLAGNEVNYLARKRSKSLDSRAAFHLWNPGEPPPLDSVPSIDAVINLVGEPIAQRWNESVKRRICESRVEATRRLVSAIKKLRHKPSVLISASATGYYGDQGSEILTETSDHGNDFLAGLCAQWEQEALQANDFGLRVVLLRIAPVLGRDGGILPKILPVFRSGLGGRLASGKQWMPWIHIEDLVRLLLFASENPAMRGAFNASAPQPVTNAEFTVALGRALHRPTFFSVPQFALRLAFGEMAKYITTSQRVLPQASEAAGFSFQYPDLVSALTDLLC